MVLVRASFWQHGHATQLFQTDGSTFVRRRHGETLHQDCVAPTVKYGGGGIMMWGAMSYNGTAFLTKVNGNLNGAGYINILENSAVPSAHILGLVITSGSKTTVLLATDHNLLLNGKLKTTLDVYLGLHKAQISIP